MLLVLYIFAVVIIAYGIFVTLAIVGFNKLNQYQGVPEINNDTVFISIVLSARNEAANIVQCLNELTKQEFPAHCYQIILVDDASDDNTFELASSFLEKTQCDFQLIKQTTHQGKKRNLAQAISLAKGSIIVTTDADVISRSVFWLATIAQYFKNNNCSLLIMPIDYDAPTSALQHFQVTENLALTGITAGYAGLQKPFLCNGANLAFTKQAYQRANGYQSHLHISSGEDVFLLEAIKKQNPAMVHYSLNRALIVKIKAELSFIQFFNQRVRWAQKAKYNSNVINFISGLLIVMANIMVLALVVAFFKKSITAPYLLIFVLTKVVFDFLLLFLASDFLGRLFYLIWLVPFSCVYWIYAIVIGVSSLFVKPRWKGKTIA